MKIGFIGLGIMGKPMSRNLLKAGYEHGGLIRTYEKPAKVEVKRSPADLREVHVVNIEKCRKYV